MLKWWKLPPPFYDSLEEYLCTWGKCDMTKDEQIKIAEIANDIKWLKRQHEEDAVWLQKSLDKIDTHLGEINGCVVDQDKAIGRNRDRIGLAWKIWIGVPVLLIGGVIGLALKLLRVY